MSFTASRSALAEPLSPFQTVADGLRIRLRVSPRASRDAIGNVVADKQGNGALKIAVTAVPEKGYANAAVIKLLAKSWRLRKSDMEIVQGLADRNKTLLIAGNGATLEEKLGPFIDASS